MRQGDSEGGGEREGEGGEGKENEKKEKEREKEKEKEESLRDAEGLLFALPFLHIVLPVARVLVACATELAFAVALVVHPVARVAARQRGIGDEEGEGKRRQRRMES